MRLQTQGQFFKIKLYAQHHFVSYQPLDRDWDDYRLANPFNQLEDYLNGFDLKVKENPNEYEHYHTPYIAILYQAYNDQIKENQEFDQNNFKQRQEFKK